MKLKHKIIGCWINWTNQVLGVVNGCLCSEVQGEGRQWWLNHGDTYTMATRERSIRNGKKNTDLGLGGADD